MNRNLISDAGQRSSFLHAHAGHLGTIDQVRLGLNDDSIRKAFQEHESRYLAVLDDATQNPDRWRRVRDNPMMVHLIMNVDDPKLLDFYDKEQEWLDDVLYLLCNATNLDDPETVSLMENDPQKDETIGRILTTIHANHPFFRDAVKGYLSDPDVDPEAGLVSVFSLFENFGDTIRYCAKNKTIPLEELLDVLFANPDYCEKYDNLPPEQFAAKLITIRNQAPDVWKNHGRPLVFQLYDDVPHLANSLCRKLGTDDVATFIYLNYDDAVPQAAAAIDKFDDLAMYVLSKYSQSDTFRRHLKDTTLGVRIVPYVTRFEDKGLERLAENKAWLDKYFDAEGNPKEEEWWRSIPGGSAVGIAKNWAAGVPSEWSELGWAAIEVGEAALLVVTLSASAPASAVKSSVTTTAKVGTKSLSKNVTKSVLKSSARSTKSGARSAAKTQHSSLLRQSVTRSAAGSFRLVPRSIAGKVRLVSQMAHTVTIAPVKVIATKTFQAARQLSTTWKNVPLHIRRVVYKSLLVTGLTFTLIYRTLPMIRDRLPDLGNKIGEAVGEAVQTAAKTLAATLDGFLEKLIGFEGSRGGNSFRAWFIYCVIFLVLLASTFFQGKHTFWRRVPA